MKQNCFVTVSLCVMINDDYLEGRITVTSVAVFSAHMLLPVRLSAGLIAHTESDDNYEKKRIKNKTRSAKTNVCVFLSYLCDKPDAFFIIFNRSCITTPRKTPCY